MPALNDILTERLKHAENKGLSRKLVASSLESGPFITREGRRYIQFSGNDYLALRAHPAVIEAAKHATDEGGGSGASRLVTGNHAYYGPLESGLADYKKTESALVFGSGYLANLGTIAALVQEGDLILADKLAHACMLDGARLSGATLKRYAHNDTTHLSRLLEENRSNYRHCLILTESVFSMDGDRAPLREIAQAAQRHDAWLLIDDAHGIGFGMECPDAIWSGTLSKALGSYGGYVAGSQILIDYLTSHARSLIFSTGLPPATIAAATAALAVLAQEPGRAERALRHARRLSVELGLPEAESPIVPIILGTPEAALDASHRLAEAGLWASAIRPPTVPPGTARLRITCTAAHEDTHIDQLIHALRPICKP